MKLGHEERKCEFCGGPFITRMRSRRKTCCRKCSSNLIMVKRRARYVNSIIAGKRITTNISFGIVDRG